jgi:hypothetical protein
MIRSRPQQATLSGDLDVTVYVDDARIRWRGKDWFHLVADEAEELHLAAGALGLRREWAQDRGRTLHYDLTDHLRERAIALGIAEPIGWRELARWRAGALPMTTTS